MFKENRVLFLIGAIVFFLLPIFILGNINQKITKVVFSIILITPILIGALSLCRFLHLVKNKDLFFALSDISICISSFVIIVLYTIQINEIKTWLFGIIVISFYISPLFSNGFYYLRKDSWRNNLLFFIINYLYVIIFLIPAILIYYMFLDSSGAYLYWNIQRSIPFLIAFTVILLICAFLTSYFIIRLKYFNKNK